MSDEMTEGLPRPRSRREVLVALQLGIEQALRTAEVKEISALSRELRQVVAELEGLPNPQAMDAADDLAAARERRRQEAARAAAGSG